MEAQRVSKIDFQGSKFHFLCIRLLLHEERCLSNIKIVVI